MSSLKYSMQRKWYFMVLLFISAFLIQNCKKDHTEIGSQEAFSIAGNWELRQEQTRTIPIINYPAGNGNLIKFTADEYSTFANGNRIKTGPFKLISDLTAAESVCLVLPGNQFKNRIVFDSVYNSRKTFIEISKDSLKFISGCFAVDSGYYYLYIRQ